ncbi:UNVERIFIED_CONTAM: HDIG domain-containing protein [Halobacillus marinus]
MFDRMRERFFKGGWRTSKPIIGLLALVVAAFFFILAIPNIQTQTYNLEKYGTAPETIRSPITIENEQKTDQQIREVTRAVDDRYTVSEDITEERISMIEEIFDVVEETGAEGDDAAGKEEQLRKVQALLSDEITSELPTEIFLPLLQADKEERETAEQFLIPSVHTALEDGIRAEDLPDAERNIHLKAEYSSVPASLKQVVSDIAAFGLVENSLYDPRRTEEAIKSAASQVEPIMIRAGEVLVQKGSTITNDIYEDLRLTGVLKEQRNLLPFLGLACFALLLGTIMYMESFRAVHHYGLSLSHLAITALISIFMVFLMKMISLYDSMDQPIFYLVPAATGAVLIKVLCRERLALVMAILYALMGCVLFNGQLSGTLNAAAGMYLLLSQLAGIFFLTRKKERLSIVKASAGVAITNICTILFFLFISFEKYTWSEVLLYCGYGFAAAMIAAVLTLGLLPFFETGFGILSDQKLLALASPNHPVLRKILIEAPGTYHHSVMVANLSEAACESIGANGLLARVAAYYHDLGKTVKPHFFIENQMGMKNPHDYMEPEESAEIIIDHPYAGAAMLEKENFPPEIIAIAEQHHGTTLLKYFFHKAQERRESVKEEEFRYPGPKPQTKEAAIINICDSVEAAVRSLDHPTADKIRSIVRSIMESRLLDGQLDDSHLTFNDLKKLEYAICETLQGIYHSRIEYPDTKQLVREAK